jgi:hypothetical protein
MTSTETANATGSINMVYRELSQTFGGNLMGKGLLLVELYRGHEINVNLHTQQMDDDFRASIQWTVAGMTRHTNYIAAEITASNQVPTQKRINVAINNAKKAIDKMEQEKEMRPTLEAMAGREWATVPATEETPNVGDVASLYSRGRVRFGLVTKVTATKIEIAYTTPGAMKDAAKYGRAYPAVITRKADTYASVGVVVNA